MLMIFNLLSFSVSSSILSSNLFFFIYLSLIPLFSLTALLITFSSGLSKLCTFSFFIFSYSSSSSDDLYLSIVFLFLAISACSSSSLFFLLILYLLYIDIFPFSFDICFLSFLSSFSAFECLLSFFKLISISFILLFSESNVLFLYLFLSNITSSLFFVS